MPPSEAAPIVGTERVWYYGQAYVSVEHGMGISAMDFFKLETYDLPKTAEDKRLRKYIILALAAVSAIAVVVLLVFLLR